MCKHPNQMGNISIWEYLALAGIIFAAAMIGTAYYGG